MIRRYLFLMLQMGRVFIQDWQVLAMVRLE
ncbi:hypothetical protein CFSAN002237_19960 [Escherichia coli O104:H21 str. CFSAN002237]|nr:hypothetical protein PPECC33_02273 [Escherichia coli PCN033]ERF89332.1 hypothetical protein CFSAN002237_19960 [Escherichia coli O104:H21 str. CFSAN002237]OMI43441.1 hypothetical protein MP33_16195 [Escherichia coli N37058PS]